MIDFLLFFILGVQFRIDEVELSKKMENLYNESVKLWVELLHKFEEAAELIGAEKKMKKTMWGQFWSSHQRFFKYLCIASKVHHVCRVASDVIKMGKCVVIGLQSTGNVILPQIESAYKCTYSVCKS